MLVSVDATAWWSIDVSEVISSIFAAVEKSKLGQDLQMVENSFFQIFVPLLPKINIILLTNLTKF